jgi:hypothetical protein
MYQEPAPIGSGHNNFVKPFGAPQVNKIVLFFIELALNSEALKFSNNMATRYF